MDDLRRHLEAQLAQREPGVLAAIPPERYIGFFDDLPKLASYRAVPGPARDACDAIRTRAGPDGLEIYHRLVLVALIGQTDRRLRNVALTAEVRSLLMEHLDRICDDLAKPRRRYYVHSNDRFAKDFAICRLKLLPCGAELVDPYAGVSRRILLSGGFRQLCRAVPYFGLRLGGFAPFFALHFDRRLTADFHAEGYTRLYLTIADLLERHRHVKGLISGSWWHDPQLKDISPDLAFINTAPESSGARCFRAGTDEEVTKDATKLSAVRSAAFTEGRYFPCSYLLVWPRSDILAWARRTRRTRSEASE